MKHVRWGLLSTARINRRVIPAIRASRRSVLAAVASRTLETAQAYAETWEIPHAFGSYQEMLDSGKIDAVYIGLPNHMHAEWSIRSLSAGVHVLCEKPMTVSLEEMDAMIAARDGTGLHLAEAFMYRHHPQTMLVGEWVRAGKLGDVTLVRATFGFALSRRDDIRLVPEYGGGCLWDVGIYPLSFAQYIMGGPPEWVTGAQWTGDTGVDEVFVGQMGYPGNRFAHIAASFRTPYHASVEIVGTEGRLTLNRPFTGMDETARVFHAPANGEETILPVPMVELYQGEVDDLNAAILDGKPCYLTLAESRDHVRTALALHQSAHDHSIVHL